MKKFLFVALGLLALPSVASAIDINAGGAQPTWTFDTAPVVADFSTGVTPGANTVINNEATWDTTVNASAASVYASAVGTSATNPPTSQANVFRHNTDPAALWLQSSATGGSSVGLIAKLNNETPNYISDLTVSFDFAETAAETGTTTGPPGYRVYWSPTGAAGSWTFLGAPLASQNYSFTIPGLGTSFGDNTAYVLWSDDNAEGGTDGQYHIDNVSFNATLGGLKAPPVPEFGTELPPAVNTVGAGDLDLASSSGGVAEDEGGNQILHLNNGGASMTSELVDLRGLNAGDQVFARLDFRTFEDSAGSDFETTDSLVFNAEWSADGLAFQTLEVANLIGGAATGDPADELKALDTGGAGGAFTTLSAQLPATAKTVRLIVNASNNSATEHFYFDNLRVDVVPVPEPASVAMIGLGMIGLVGYGIRRRRSA